MVEGDEIVLGPLPKGIAGHTDGARAVSESSFAFETLDLPGSVPGA
ncbi:hypothetical protein [Actinomycetospora aeridis]|uniref:Uncharacterized protein n=1 Tax=Actinomycetospora aeridis TaxID=3129231 RepID=A0ABU8NDV3_9PSEU